MEKPRTGRGSRDRPFRGDKAFSMERPTISAVRYPSGDRLVGSGLRKLPMVVALLRIPEPVEKRRRQIREAIEEK